MQRLGLVPLQLVIWRMWLILAASLFENGIEDV